MGSTRHGFGRSRAISAGIGVCQMSLIQHVYSDSRYAGPTSPKIPCVPGRDTGERNEKKFLFFVSIGSTSAVLEPNLGRLWASIPTIDIYMLCEACLTNPDSALDRPRAPKTMSGRPRPTCSKLIIRDEITYSRRCNVMVLTACNFSGWLPLRKKFSRVGSCLKS
jgi:hypothetical protein